MFGMQTFLRQWRRRTPLGWLQLSHERSRMLVALSGIAFADILIFMQLGFQNALYDSNTRLHQSLDADLVLLSPQAQNLIRLSKIPRRRLYQSLDVPGVAEANPVYVNVTSWKNPQTREETSILVLGFDPDRPAFALPELADNPDFQRDLKLRDRFWFDRGARGPYEGAIARLDAGEIVETEIEQHRIQISGTYRVGASFAADGSLMTSDRNFLRAFSRWQPGSISLGALQLEPGADPERVQAALGDRLPADVRVLTHEEFVEFEKQYWFENTAVGFVFGMGTAMGFVVGVIIVYQVLATDVNDHLGEYATFKAMGYRYRYFLGVIAEEALILAAIGFLPGLGVSLGLYAVARNATNLPLFMTLTRAVGVWLLTAVMCGLSGAIAARKLQAADPADMF